MKEILDLLRLGDETDTSDPLDWQRDAICAQTDPELFFPDFERQGKNAKRICENCPVKQKCFDYAVKNNEENGIWGGVDFTIRRMPTREVDSYRFEDGKDQTALVVTSEFLRMTMAKKSKKKRGKNLDNDYGY